MHPRLIPLGLVAAVLAPGFAACAAEAVTPAVEGAQGRISVVAEGQGPDVILIPGLASSRDVWTDLRADLAPDYRVHSVGVAGFAGQAPVEVDNAGVAAPVAEAIAAYIRDQKLQAPAIIGHSLGGEVALMLAARHPDLPGRVMAVDALPFYSLLLDPQATAESMQPRAAAFRDAILATPDSQAEALQSATLARLIKTDAARPARVADALRSDPQTVASATYELMTTDLRPELKAIQAPVSVVYAYDATYGFPAAMADALFRQAYAGTPDVRFDRVDDSYHFVMLDQPAALRDQVRAFLKR